MQKNYKTLKYNTKIQSWMQNEALQKIFFILNSNNKQKTIDDFDALCVGGCVRNTVLNISINDIDIATKHKPNKVLELMKEQKIQCIPTGLSHGTVTAVLNDQSFEITTLRKDLETDGRHAKIGFSKSWIEDAQRRDFTCNTLLCDLNGTIYDPLGTGYNDTLNRDIQFVGQAETRIQEDALRILRFFRFWTYYGSADPDAHALAACKAHAHLIKNLSKERINQEFLKILGHQNAAKTLKIIFELGLLKDICFQTDLNQLSQFISFQTRFNLDDANSDNAHFRLAMLARTDEDLSKIIHYLRLTNKSIQNLKKSYDESQKINENMSYEDLKTQSYWLNVPIMMNAYLISAAKHSFLPIDTLENLKNWKKPYFPVTGDELIALGLKQGPELGHIIKKVEQWWVDHNFKPAKDECIEYAKTLF